MASRKQLFPLAASAALLLILVAPAQASAPQATSGTYLEIETASEGQTTLLKLSLGDNAMRMDADTPQGGVSVVSLGGEDGKMLMMMHSQRSYMEFTAEMLAGMAGMMGQMPTEAEEPQDMTPPTFTRTGNTKQVGEWAAYEVLVQHPDQDDTIMWFSQDLDADFRALAEQVVTSMQSLLNSPMVRMAGGGGGSNPFDQIEAQLRAADMPDGFPVQIIAGSSASQTINTLRSINQAASFEATTWEAPEGYTKMTMPFGR